MTVVAIATAIHGSYVPSTCHTQANCLAIKHTYDACTNMYTTHVDWKCESTKICSKASGNWTTDKSLSFKTKPSHYFYLGIVAEGGVIINSKHPHDYTTTTGEIGSCVSSNTSYAHHKKCKGGDADEDKCLWKFCTPGIPSDAECNPPAPAAPVSPPNYPAPAPVYYPAPAPVYSAPAYPVHPPAPAYPVHPHNPNYHHDDKYEHGHGGQHEGEHDNQHEEQDGGEPQEDVQDVEEPQEDVQDVEEPQEDVQDGGEPQEDVQDGGESQEDVQDVEEPQEDVQTGGGEPQNGEEPQEDVQDDEEPQEDVQNGEEPQDV
jgi:hypothetical protein